MRFKGPKKLVGIGGFNWYGGQGETLCLDAPSRPWLDMSFGIVSPFRGWSATDAQGTWCTGNHQHRHKELT